MLLIKIVNNLIKPELNEQKQLVVKLSGALNLSKADVERILDTITNTILDALKNDDSVKIVIW